MTDPYNGFKQDFTSALRASAHAARTEANPATNPTARHAAPSSMTPIRYTPVDTSGVGDFPWQWNQFGTFNGNTWGFLNTVATKSDDGLITLTPGLATNYYNIISATAYLWTDQDRAALNTFLVGARSMHEHIIGNYVSMFSAIGPPEKAKAATALGLHVISGLSYILEYRIGFQWSGREAAGLPPLSAAELRIADFGELFAHAPDGARDALLGPIQQMVKQETQWAAKIDDLWNTTQSIRDAANNTQSPVVDNKSAMYVVQSDGSSVVRHSFSVTPSVSDIRKQLSAATTMTVDVSAKKSTGGAAAVSVAGGPETPVPDTAIALKPEGGTAKGLLSHDGTGDEAVMTVTYHGPTEIAVTASPFAPDASTGWYFEHPITQAAENQANDVTQGYQFLLPVGDDLTTAAGFGLISTLLVCRSVTIGVVFPKGDMQRLAASIPAGTNVSATVHENLNLAGTSDTPLVVSLQNDPATGAPSITLSTISGGGTGAPGPLAHVIGAQIHRPTGAFVPPVLRASTAENTSARRLPHLPQIAAARAQIADPRDAVVAVYEDTFGTIKPKQLLTAHAQSKFDYIISNVLGQEWRGPLDAKAAPLTITDMRSARNLRHLFPNMPFEGTEVLTQLHDYLSRTPQ